jgi:HD-GYP domain-containing protein (c-di-GMP phosphodiesterase class II)
VRHPAAGVRAALAASAGLLWLVFYAGWLLVQPGGEETLRVFADTAYLVPLAAATGLTFFAWLRVPSGMKPFWGFMTLACTAWLSADAAWCLRDLVSGSVPYPWWSDLGYIVSDVLLLCAVYTAFKPRFRTVGLERLLDGALVVLPLAMLWWWFLMRPVGFGGDLASVVDLAYPLFGLLVLGLLVSARLLPARQGTLGVWLVAVGIASGVLANALYVYMSQTDGYLTGAWIEMGWQVQGVVFSVAAFIGAWGLGRPPDWMSFREWPRLAKPILAGGAVGTGAGLLALDATSGGLSHTLLGAVALLGLLLAVRLGLAFRPSKEVPADPATGAHDAGYWGERLRHLSARGRHFGEPFAVALALPDAGRVGSAGAALALASSGADTVSDLGEQGFGILFARVEEDDAVQLAERLREASASIQVTFSLGVAMWTPDLHPRELLAEAERAAARAQRLGGNQVHVAHPGEVELEDDPRSVLDLADLVARRERMPAGHSHAVASLAAELAAELGLDADSVARTFTAGYLHDVGKVTLPRAVLCKTAPLDTHELAALRLHPTRGGAIVERFPSIADAAPIVATHHESWDGSGYPDGLSYETIPIESRVVTVANSLVSMTSDRPYRPAHSTTTALTTLWQQSGRRFDPDVVKTVLAVSAEGRLTLAHQRDGRQLSMEGVPPAARFQPQRGPTNQALITATARRSR